MWKDICRIRDQQVSLAQGMPLIPYKRWIYQLWDSVVSRYSIGQLSFEEDKLAVLAGIATYVEELLQDEYLVGMWRNDLARQMCWSVSTPDLCTRRLAYIAPTWSWLTLNDSRISMPDPESAVFFVDILDAQVISQPNDRETSSKARVVAGFLDVACFLVPGVLRFKNVTWGPGYKITVKGGPDLNFLHAEVDLDIHRHQTRDVWLMPALGGDNVTGLILERRNEDQGAFRRLGRFCLFISDISEETTAFIRFWQIALDSIPGETGTIATESQELWKSQEPLREILAPCCKTTGTYKNGDDVTEPDDGVWFLNLSHVVQEVSPDVPSEMEEDEETSEDKQSGKSDKDNNYCSKWYKKYDGVSRLKIRII
ncbi:uncharacterized protein BDZ99DRAFT_22972 [Mytilinidion resinicola]|uniref:Heterokaryon incompatibility protein n=1 Tax=Mytilinidion resinicola TaxID=574789 RepID=A0A6A6Z996_9PEZI|nr:uncharacterized protein BDZ99DRAFT_22972 [Mytilinidion resinicola]KAF2817702.1 hypothetical protein BDZ99DRAFT_22972 [Mytilinidion resinicola]